MLRPPLSTLLPSGQPRVSAYRRERAEYRYFADARANAIVLRLAVAFAMIVGSSAARAQEDWCPAVTDAANDSHNGFSALRGALLSRTAEGAIYAAKAKLPQATECAIEDDPQLPAYHCVWAFITRRDRDMGARFIADKVAACLGVTVQPGPRGSLYDVSTKTEIIGLDSLESGPPDNAAAVRLSLMPWGD